jgi:hypothetical protein
LKSGQNGEKSKGYPVYFLTIFGYFLTFRKVGKFGKIMATNFFEKSQKG